MSASSALSIQAPDRAVVNASQLPGTTDRFVRNLEASNFWDGVKLSILRERQPISRILPSLRTIFAHERAHIHSGHCEERAWRSAHMHFGQGYLHHEIARTLNVGAKQVCADCFITVPPVLLKHDYLRQYGNPPSDFQPCKEDVIAALRLLHVESATKGVGPWVTAFNTWIEGKGPQPEPINFDLTTSPCLPSVYVLGALKLPFPRMASEDTEDYLPKGTITPMKLEEGIFAVALSDRTGQIKDIFAITDIHGTRLTSNKEWFRRARGAAGNFTMATMGQGPFSLRQAFSPRPVTRSINEGARALRSYAYVFGKLLNWKPSDRILQVPTSFKGETISPRICLGRLKADAVASQICLVDPKTEKGVALYTVLGITEEGINLSSPTYVGDAAQWASGLGVRQRDVHSARRWMEDYSESSIPRLEAIQLTEEILTGTHTPLKKVKGAYFLHRKITIDGYTGTEMYPRCVYDTASQRRMIAFFASNQTRYDNPVAAIYTDLNNASGEIERTTRIVPQNNLKNLSLVPGEDAPVIK